MDNKDLPGIGGTQFKITLNKKQFAGNMSTEQIEEIARDLGFVEHGPIIIRDLGKEETLADLMQNNPNLTKEELLYWCPEFKEQ